MSEDPYAALGLTKGAGPEAIKQAYRAHVKTTHPDLNPKDPTAAARFKRIAAAYALLSDPEARARGDRRAPDAAGRGKARPRAAGGAGGAQGAGADASHQSGPRGARSGARPHGSAARAARYRLTIDFLEAATGVKKRVTTEEGAPFTLAIPPGVAHGETLRLKRRDAAGRGVGPAGDALIEIAVRPHPRFERVADDITTTLPISIEDALRGAKVVAPTLFGPVRVAIPKHASNGDVLRLKGRGVARPGRPAGDLRIVLQITPQAKRPNWRVKGLLETWRAKPRLETRARVKSAG